MKKVILIIMAMLFLTGIASAGFVCTENEANLSIIYTNGTHFSIKNTCPSSDVRIIQEFACGDSDDAPYSYTRHSCGAGEACMEFTSGAMCSRFPICMDTDLLNDVHIRGIVTVIRDAYSGTDFPDQCDTASPQILEGYCTADRLKEYERKNCPAGEECSEGVCVESEDTAEPTCTDPDLDRVDSATSVTGVYATGEEYEIADRCDPDNMPSGVLEAACTDSAPFVRTITCPEGQVCALGKCQLPLTSDKLREESFREIKNLLTRVKVPLNSLEKQLCKLPTAPSSNEGNVNTFSNLQTELKAVNDQLARIEKCRTGKDVASVKLSSNNEANIAEILASIGSNAKELKKAILKTSGMHKKTDASPSTESKKEEQGKKTLAGDKTPAAEQDKKTPAAEQGEKTPAGTKTPAPAAKKTFWSKLFGK